jgi:hypothetical protein
LFEEQLEINKIIIDNFSEQYRTALPAIANPKYKDDAHVLVQVIHFGNL